MRLDHERLPSGHEVGEKREDERVENEYGRS